MKITKDCKVWRAGKYPFLNLDNEVVVVVPRERMSHQMNEVGAAIWNFIGEKKRKLSEIVEYVVSEFEVDEKVAERDICEFLGQLKEKNLVKVER